MKKTIASLLLIAFYFTAAAQDTIPLLKGTVEVSIKQGTIKCDLTLSNYKHINNYYIRLNAGMNVLYFKNAVNGRRIFYSTSNTDSMGTGEAIAYYFKANNNIDKFLPKAIQIKYTGMYPVANDTIDNFAVADWKGNIAFNGYSVRADGAQSAWYPYLYDVTNDKSHEEVKYDIEYKCDDCNALYLNGSLPVKGSKAHFVSDQPHELIMYCGRYKTQNEGGTYFLNPDIKGKALKDFGSMTNDYKAYYAKETGIPYNGAITYIYTTPTSKFNNWMFVTYPTIVSIGYQNGFAKFSDKNEANDFKPYMAHELGHYYFGTYRRFNSVLGDMITEGFAEYMSMRITQNLIQDSVYKNKLKEKAGNLKGFKGIAFSKITSTSDYKDREAYVYNYAPIIFTAMQKELGEATMWAWIKNILTIPATYTNYDFFAKTLDETLQDKAKSDALKAKYFESDQALENAWDELKK